MAYSPVLPTPDATALPAAPAILVRDLVTTYSGHPAVRGVGFEVACGEIIGLLVPDGAGKSPPLRILSGYLPEPPCRTTWASANTSTSAPASRT